METKLLEVAIGLVLVWLVASCVVSGLVEALAKALQMRSHELERELTRWVEPADSGHQPGSSTPVTAAYKRRTTAKASSAPRFEQLRRLVDPGGTGRFTKQEIPRSTFAHAALQLEPGTGADASSLDKVIDSIKKHAGAAKDQVPAQLEEWFDGRMSEVSARYKRGVRPISVVAGAVVALVLGIDSIHLTERLYNDSELRSDLVTLAGTVHEESYDSTKCLLTTTTTTTTTDAAKATTTTSSTTSTTTSSTTSSTTSTTTAPPDPSTTTTDPPQSLEEAREELLCVQRLVGMLTDLELVPTERRPWTCDFWAQRWHRGAGIAVTAVAIGFGAPFWFANLKRLMARRPKEL